MRSGLLALGITVWVLLQPDLSTSIVLVVIWFALLWMAGLPVRYMVVLGLAAVVISGLAFPFLEEYQQARIVTFLFPDPNARHGNEYNVEQALVTIGFWRVVWSGVWTQFTGSVALPEGPAYGLYFLSNGS